MHVVFERDTPGFAGTFPVIGSTPPRREEPACDLQTLAYGPFAQESCFFVPVKKVVIRSLCGLIMPAQKKLIGAEQLLTVRVMVLLPAAEL